MKVFISEWFPLVLYFFLSDSGTFLHWQFNFQIPFFGKNSENVLGRSEKRTDQSLIESRDFFFLLLNFYGRSERDQQSATNLINHGREKSRRSKERKKRKVFFNSPTDTPSLYPNYLRWFFSLSFPPENSMKSRVCRKIFFSLFLWGISKISDMLNDCPINRGKDVNIQII